MANKRFWLGMLVLAFGMLVVGCVEPDYGYEPEPIYCPTILVTGIPGNRNGQTFTISLIYHSNPFASKEGIITGNGATVDFELDDLPEGGLIDYIPYYLSLKIEYDTAKISTNEVFINWDDIRNGRWEGYLEKEYNDLFGGN